MTKIELVEQIMWLGEFNSVAGDFEKENALDFAIKLLDEYLIKYEDEK